MPKVLSSVNPIHKTVNEERACIICLATDKPLEKFQGSCKCKPDIHIKCMDDWLTKNGRTCPICRQKYPETNIQKEENEANRLRATKEQENCILCTFCCYLCCIPIMQALH